MGRCGAVIRFRGGTEGPDQQNYIPPPPLPSPAKPVLTLSGLLLSSHIVLWWVAAFSKRYSR